jgi:ArsR family transcriptional regulator, arsenate/arsenite/antimonite-responsive transcriptional repressor
MHQTIEADHAKFKDGDGIINHNHPGSKRTPQKARAKFLLTSKRQRGIISLFDEIYMREFIAVAKAISDPNRARILLALRGGELCVCQITELFGFAPSTVSKHLSILHQAGLIQSRKTERWVFYRLAEVSASRPARAAIDWVHRSLAQSDEAGADAKQLKKIRNADLSEICRRQRC